MLSFYEKIALSSSKILEERLKYGRSTTEQSIFMEATAPRANWLALLMKNKLTVGFAVAIVGGGGWWWTTAHKPQQPLRYVLSPVQKMTIVTSVSGSGQVSGENQVDLKPTVSAAVTKILVQTGATVKQGDPLMQLDTKDAQKTVRDAGRSVQNAQLSLASAKLSLDKLKAPPDAQTLLKAQDALNQAQRALDDLKKGADATDIASAEADLAIKQNAVRLSSDGTTAQTVRDGLDAATSNIKTSAQFFRDALKDADNILAVDNPGANTSYASLLSVMNSALLPRAQSSYKAAKDPVVAFKIKADALSASGASESSVLAVASQGAQVAEQLSVLLTQVQDVLANTIISSSFSQSSLDSLRNSISSDRNSTITKHDSLADVDDTITDAKTAYNNALLDVQKSQASLDKLKEGASASDLASAEERVKEAQAAVDALKAGPTAIDLASQHNSISQRNADLASAADKYRDALDVLNSYTIRAPFEGTVGSIAAKVGDQAGGSTALLTLLTEAKIAKITMNEVDSTKLKQGQKATLTFDAIPDLTIAGTVSAIDSIGNVSQGVVDYGVTIVFQTQDDRIKPGMSVSANIVTDAHADVLAVPNGAVHMINGSATVQTLSPSDTNTVPSAQGITSATPPQAVEVGTGLANDQDTEIISGLKEGDLVVTRTINPNITTAATASGGTGTRVPGLGGGNATFIGGGAGGNFTRTVGR
jgi:multidrug efflux pump subunit AcrA (membrane-fusion protein)